MSGRSDDARRRDREPWWMAHVRAVDEQRNGDREPEDLEVVIDVTDDEVTSGRRLSWAAGDRRSTSRRRRDR